MLKVVEPGIMNTVQDAGRWGYQAFGVPVSGAMDLPALRMANELVENAPDEAALEVHSLVVLRTDRPHLIAVTGAEASVRVDGRAMPAATSLFVRGGSTVEVHLAGSGWSYLAVHGGIDVPRVLGSRSTYVRGRLGGLQGRALEPGDEIPVGIPHRLELAGAAGRQVGSHGPASISSAEPATVRALWGPHQDEFTDRALAAFTQTSFVLSETADRMGYRLRGERLTRRGPSGGGELVSCGVPLGAVQIPPDGQPIVLMADHQTTGGYPIIATIVTNDIPVVAQLQPGQGLNFKPAKAV